MAGSTYMGIPRKVIPWYPSIDQDLCTGCSACFNFCRHNVYGQREKTSVVVNPYNCIVGCSSCLKECKTDALSFPDIKKLTEILNDLREKYKKTS